LLITLFVLVAAPTSAETIQDMVGQVSQSQYQAYQQTIESMGLGLYDSSYNQCRCGAERHRNG
jgi:hypothetical protein